MPNVLIVDKCARESVAYAALAALPAVTLTYASTGDAGSTALRSQKFDFIIIDSSTCQLSDTNAVQTLPKGGTPFLVAAEIPTVHDAVAAIRAGAVDYLDKNSMMPALVKYIQDIGSDGPDAGREDDGDTMESAACARWATLMIGIIKSPTDPRTLASWARAVAVSRGTIRNWCRIANVPARSSLMLGRVLRALVHRQRLGLRIEDYLDIVDKRTLVKLLAKCGMVEAGEIRLPSDLEAALRNQTLIQNETAVREMRRMLWKTKMRIVGPRDERDCPKHRGC